MCPGVVVKMLLSGGLMLPLSSKQTIVATGRPAKVSSTDVVVKPFKKQLHYTGKSTADGSKVKSMASVPIQLRGMDPVSVMGREGR